MVTMRYLKAVYDTVVNGPKYVGEAVHDQPGWMKQIVNQLNKMRLWQPTMQKDESDNG